ncbi:Phage-related protein, tail component [Albimonas donghaensis]|uniref:Phage-related protein, tail component n=1 Tax=Albimonas donghaensis TaxID=356660 RepID=A0A1H3FHG9_9RHOB|nr:hypothetical protein [Albimonas donghaensis]SDX90573.1 Phage-related protein, tail component [Albimonas donghaensis]
MTRLIPVTAAPLFDPAQARRELELPEGLTVAEMVAAALPALAEEDRRRLRVTLVTARGMSAPDPATWSRLRPRHGARVVIRLVPGDDPVLRSVLLIAVAVAAIYVAGPVAGAILGVAAPSTTATAITAAVLTGVGGLLVGALIPPPSAARQDAARSIYQVQGWRNEARPGEPVPFLLGRHRYAPPFAAPSYTEIVGDEQYVRGLFCFGYGRLDISDLRLGDTPLSDFEDVEVEIREGVPGDDPVTLYPRQVIEESVGVELIRPLPRDVDGDVIVGDSAIATPVVRWTAADAASVNLIFAFSSGLFEASSRGALRSRSVSILIRQRPEAGGAWSDVVTLEIAAKKRESFFRQVGWDLPSRGRWQIEVTRLTDESTSPQVADRVSLAGLQSIRPEYPLAIARPLALVALRIRASYQLNGALDDLNGIVQRFAPEWDGEDWADGLSRNPASAYLAALTGPQNPYPVSEAGIDMDLVADWFDWCAAQGLKYDRVHDRAESFGDMLRAICAAGRASPRHDGLRWGVVIDRPQTVAVDHVSPRNASGIRWSRPYVDLPHGFRVTFFDETNGWASAERIVRRPGYEGEIELTEALDVPGKTDPDEVAIEATRRMLELIHRPDRFSAVQDGIARVATRGDLVMGSFDVLDRVQRSARVKAVEGRLVELDEVVAVEDGTDYAIRFRVYADDEDTIGESVVSAVTPAAVASGETRLLRLATSAEAPSVGELIHFGTAGSESHALRVRAVEPGEDMASVYAYVADAPEIEAALADYEPPAWNGRVGAEIAPDPVTPAAPRFVEILTGRTGMDDPDGLRVLLAPGSGSAAPLASYRLGHRLAGAPSWTELSLPLAAGGVAVSGYAAGDDVELRALAVAVDGTEGPLTATVAVTIGEKDSPLPGALDSDAIEVQGGLGSLSITLAATADEATTRVQAYLVPVGDTLDAEAHALGQPFAVSPGATLSYLHGDGTRRELVEDGGFNTGAGWTAGPGWVIASGVAAHTPGSVGGVGQPQDLAEGKTYRLGFTVSGRTAGTVTPRLTGGTAQAGDAVASDGLALSAIVATAGNDGVELLASIDFDGAVDDVRLYRETGRCLSAGAWDVYLEPQDLAGVPGPRSGPFPIIVY